MSSFYPTAVKPAPKIVVDIIKIYVHHFKLKHGMDIQIIIVNQKFQTIL